MRRNSMLSFLKEKSVLVVLTLMLVSAGTMGVLFTQREAAPEKNSQIAQKETEELAEVAQKTQISQIELLEKQEEIMENNVAAAELQPELEDQYVGAEQIEEFAAAEVETEEVSAGEVVAEEFQEAGALMLQWPVEGNVLMEFSMDHSVYFQTLAQYQYNPAMVIRAAEGTEVLCAADGTVTDVGTSNEYGNYLTMDLGDGFALTYGQLGEVTSEVGEVLEKGERIGVIASPSRSYSLEGENLYLKLTKDGVPVNPQEYLE